MKIALEALIDLQEVDSKIQKLEQSKGDFPQKVKALSLQVENLEQNLENKRLQNKSLKSDHIKIDSDLVLLQVKLKKYQTQLYQVKTNKEYDAVTLEIENAKEAIDQLELDTLEIDEVISSSENEAKTLEQEVEEKKKELTETNSILNELLVKTHEEEELLIEQRNTILTQLSKPVIGTYERIRNGRGGSALALLKDGACSKCSSRIPPQRGLEIRMMNKLYFCEVCGRILVWSPDYKGNFLD